MLEFIEKFRKWFIAPVSGGDYRKAEEFIFGWQHLLLVISILSITLLIFFLFRKKSYATKRKVLLVIAFIILVCEIFTRIAKLFRYANFGILTAKGGIGEAVAIILPIHFCSIMVWFVIISIVTDNKFMLACGSVAGLIGTLVYLSYPFEGLNSPYFSLTAMNSIITHGLGFCGSFCILFWGMSKLKLSDMWKTYVFLGSSVLYAHIMNIIIPGHNFMFLVENPININFGKTPYQIYLIGGAILLVALFYLIPHFISKLLSRRKFKKGV